MTSKTRNRAPAKEVNVGARLLRSKSKRFFKERARQPMMSIIRSEKARNHAIATSHIKEQYNGSNEKRPCEGFIL
jgi:hypothetical protein